VRYLVQKGQFVEEFAILPTALFVNALRFENISGAKSRSEVIKIVVNDSQSGSRQSVAGHSKSGHVQKLARRQKVWRGLNGKRMIDRESSSKSPKIRSLFSVQR
jgi:hypothetical protein